MEAGLDRIREMLAEVLELFGRGVLRPLPVTCWDVRQAKDAFRFLGQARHIGKIALTVPRPADPEGTVLITGATGTLGALMARHLVTAHGVRHLLLAGRRGRDAAGMAELESELTGLGAQVAVAACDVADRDALAALLASLDRPLTGVVHAAGVLDDKVVTAMDGASLDRVLAPKADAAWHLHELTRGLDLPLFVLFSSATAVLGSAGQANYAAANAYLDALAQRRRGAGHHGLSLGWGLWAQASGMTGGLSEVDLTRLARGGVGVLTEEEGLSLYDAALAAGEPALVPMKLDNAALRSGTGHVAPVLRGLARRPARRVVDADAGSRTSLRDRLAGISAGERRRAILEVVRTRPRSSSGTPRRRPCPPTRSSRTWASTR